MLVARHDDDDICLEKGQGNAPYSILKTFYLRRFKVQFLFVFVFFWGGVLCFVGVGGGGG